MEKSSAATPAMEKSSAATPVGGERSERCRPPSPCTAPWLFFPHGKSSKDQAFYNICEPNHKTYKKSIPEMRRNSYWQYPSHQGWFVMLCEEDDNGYYSNSKSNSKCKFGDCFLWNPVSLDTVQLPSLRLWYDSKPTYQFYTRDCMLSSPPNYSGSMVLFLFVEVQTSKIFLVFCRPGVDKQWRTKEVYGVEKENSPRSLICFNGKFYVMFFKNPHLEIEKIGIDDDETLVLRSFSVSDKARFEFGITGGFSSFRTQYVESCDELFLVKKEYYAIDNFYKEVVTVKVYRMNFSLLAWEKVKSLGDHVLFLGENTRASCSATDLGLTRGCVYFTEPNDKSLYKFDMEDGSISVSLPCPDLPTPWLSPDWMIMPTTSISIADQRRKLEDMKEEEDIIVEAEQKKTNINNGEKGEEAQKNNGVELEEARFLSILYEEILELLTNQSVIHFENWRTSSMETTQATPLSPWLVFFRKNDSIYNFVNPMHNNEKYLVNLPELLLDAHMRFSKGGWLLMSKGERKLFFYNPFTGAVIQLPDLPDYAFYMFHGISFSSSPTSSDCKVFAIVAWGTNEVLVYTISRGDDNWSNVSFKNTDLPSKANCMTRMRYTPRFTSPVIYRRAFYCLHYDDTLGVFDLEDNSWKVLAKPQRPCINSIYKSFLVECEGNLLSVFLGDSGKWIRVFRLDFSKMVWVEVESLGKHMLFISRTSCISSVAPNSHMENKIYFPRFHGEGIIYFSLDTGRYHTVGSQHSAQDFYNTKEQLYCSWIEPNWSQTTDNELDWLSI